MSRSSVGHTVVHLEYVPKKDLQVSFRNGGKDGNGRLCCGIAVHPFCTIITEFDVVV